MISVKKLYGIALTGALLAGGYVTFSSAIEREEVTDQIASTRALAEHGDVESQIELANLYYDGEGVYKNLEESVRWFRLAADQGHPRAQDNLGWAYSNGSGVEQDQEEAVRWFRLAADQDHPNAQLNLGLAYFHGAGVDQDREEAIRWFRLAADQGYVHARVELGDAYHLGDGVDQDHEEAARWFRLAADQGDTSSKYMLGWAYSSGSGVAQDLEEALRWYRLAADQGHAKGQARMGFAYVQGEGVAQDKEEAVRWWRLAAEQDDASALHMLGWAYFYGEGVDEDLDEALRWYQLAADQGNERSEVEISVVQALIDKRDQAKVLISQAEEGDPNAQAKLAAAYHWGSDTFVYGIEGIERNQSLALKWFRKAAKQGNTHGATHLAQSYSNGSNGVELDSSECFYWALVSVAEFSYEQNEALIYQCGSRLSLEKQEKIRKKASKFRNKFNMNQDPRESAILDALFDR